MHPCAYHRLQGIARSPFARGHHISVARVTEIIASLSKSVDDAVENSVKRASETLKNIKSAWVQAQNVMCKDGEITEYRVTMKVTFVLDD